jgi:hypothetical protein
LDILDRKKIQDLRSICFAMSSNNLNFDFSKAYIELGFALDKLDALHARFELDNAESPNSVLDK